MLADATQRNAEVIQALGMADRFKTRWSRVNERYLRENIRASDLFANLGSGAKALRYVLQSGMLGIGAYLVVSDKASGGVMVASSIMMGRALAPVEVALGSWKQLVAARQGVARLGVSGGYGQAAAVLGGIILGGLPEILAFLQNALRDRQDRFARLGDGSDALAVAHEDLDSELLLQQLDLFADSGLRGMQLIRCGGEVEALLLDFANVPELLQLHEALNIY